MQGQQESNKAEEYKVARLAAGLSAGVTPRSFDLGLLQNATLQLQEAATELQAKRELRSHNLTSHSPGELSLSVAQLPSASLGTQAGSCACLLLACLLADA